MSTFADWCLTDAESCVRVDLKAWDGSQEIELYLSTHAYEADYLDRLVGDLVIVQSLGGVFGRSGEMSIAGIQIDNIDRALDAWIDYGWHGRDVVIRLGDPSWPSTDSRWSTQFTGKVDRLEADDDVITLYCRDSMQELDVPIVTRPVSMHPSALLKPTPLALGAPQNVTPQPSGIYSETFDGNFQTNTWNAVTTAAVSSLVSEVYESGKPTVKSNNLFERLTGGGYARLNFNVTDPEGSITCDPVGATDSIRAAGGNRLNKAGEIVDFVMSYSIGFECGFAEQDGDADTLYLDNWASDVNDYYNGAGTNQETAGYIVVFPRQDSVNGEENSVADYDGATRKVTFGSSLGFSTQRGDYYEIYSPDDVFLGALPAARVDSAALTAVDTAAGYNLGIWDPGGELSYLDLLDGVFPAGFWYYLTGAGVLTCGLLELPAAGTSALTLDEYETRNKIHLVHEDVPPWRIEIGYDLNWTPQSSIDESADVTDGSFRLRDYLWEPDDDLSVLDKFPESKVWQLKSWILSQADAITEGARLRTLFGTARKLITVQGLAAFYSVVLHDVVTLKDPIYGHSAGKNYRVIALEKHLIERTADAILWG